MSNNETKQTIENCYNVLGAVADAVAAANRCCILLLLFKCLNVSNLPKSNNLISFAACMPSSLRFFSICLERCMAARSSADVVQPIFYIILIVYYLQETNKLKK
ncbi:hypothetical protein FF38_03214 [Lucilia cuprina]|uniref:Uncharacterized protein n=1 Tax=Lucilia cuprina TaxID=7375 RepID=A0A0L0BNY9_LUCCU|nr:hypothetical protein FF38_03214 [Lucilia cuprina]